MMRRPVFFLACTVIIVHCVYILLTSPVQLDVASGDTDSVRHYLESGGDPNRKLGNGDTLLVLAVESGEMAMVTELLEAGADPNLSGRAWYPLQVALGRDDSEMAKALLDSGAYSLEELESRRE